MNWENYRIRMQMAAFLVLFAGVSARAQATEDASNIPEAPAPATSSIEALNYVGGDTSMPSFSDSAINVNSEFRGAMLRKGMALRLIAQGQYAQNMLDAPVGTQSQVYVGQRAFTGAMLQPILTADLRQLHLRNAQLYLGGVCIDESRFRRPVCWRIDGRRRTGRLRRVAVRGRDVLLPTDVARGYVAD